MKQYERSPAALHQVYVRPKSISNIVYLDLLLSMLPLLFSQPDYCCCPSNRLGNSMKHYAKLVVAEHPIKEHQKYRQEREVVLSPSLPYLHVAAGASG